MPLRPLALAAALLVSVAGPAIAQSPLPSPDPKPAVEPQGAANPMRDSLAHARRLTQWFYAGQADSLLLFVPETDKPKLPKERIVGMLMELTGRVGTESEVLEEKFVKRGGNTQYWRTANYSLATEPMLFRWALNPQGQIIGQGFGPLSQAPPIDP